MTTVTDLLLAIDGGGSKTLALVAGVDGTVLGRGVAASSNYQSVGFNAATRALEAATSAALESAGYDPSSSIAAACLGLAGADRPVDKALFDAWLRERSQLARWTIVNDAELVLHAGTPNAWGIALICGTGSICYGRAADGRTARAGGWGHLIGDEGSGYAVGITALRLATQTADRRADAHALLAAVLDYWQLAEPRDLVSYVYSPERTRAEIAALAQRIAELADSGDLWAREVLAQAAHELGRLVAAVVRSLDLQEPPLAFGGGFIGAYALLRQEVVTQAGIALGPHAYVTEPAQGALVLARRLLHAAMPMK